MGNRTVGNRGANTPRPQSQDRTPLHVRVRIEQRDARLQHLGFSSYATYLASSAWEAKKAEYRASPLPQVCALCEESDVQLHHTTYERVGEEELTDLAPLCATCHQLIHVLERRGELGLDFAGLVSAQRAERYASEGQGAVNGPSWAELHAEELGHRKAAELSRAIKDLVRRCERKGIDPRPALASIRQAIKASHRRRTR